jgi:hypothetical protein
MVHRRGVLAQPNRERPHEIGITSPGFPHVQGDFARCADLELLLYQVEHAPNGGVDLFVVTGGDTGRRHDAR